MAVSKLLKMHQIFMLALAKLRCVKTGGSGARCFAVSPFGLPLRPLQLFQLLVKARRDQVLKLFAQVALIVHEFKANLWPKFK